MGDSPPFLSILFIAAVVIGAYYFFLMPKPAPPSLSLSDYSLAGNSLSLSFRNNFPGNLSLQGFDVLSEGRINRFGVPKDYPLIAPGEVRKVDIALLHGCERGQNSTFLVETRYLLPPQTTKEYANFSFSAVCS
jgi:hypothetical protein